MLAPGIETINLEIPNSASKMVVFGTLDPEQEIILDLSTSMQVNSPINIAWPENAEITFSGNVSESAETHHILNFSTEHRKYLPAKRNIRVKEEEKTG